MKWLKRILVLTIIAAVVAAVLLTLRPKPLLVDVAQVGRGSMRVFVEGHGQTRVKDRYVVAAPLHGNLARVELLPGDDVDEKTVLARVTPVAPALLDNRSRTELLARLAAAEASQKQAEAATERAKAAAAYAARELKRAEELAASGNLSLGELETVREESRAADNGVDSARFGQRVAYHQARVAKAALGRSQDEDDPAAMELGSPTQGRVLRTIRRSAGVIAPGEPILEIGDPTALEIVIDVLTADAVSISPGDRVEILRWGGQTRLQGRVRLVEPSAFTKVSALGVDEQRVNVIVDLVDPPTSWEGLGDGYRVEVEIVVWEGDDVLRVPVSALHRHEGNWATFVINDGVVELAIVEIGRRSGFEVEILEGLSSGDTVIVHPGEDVLEGTVVAPRPSNAGGAA